MVATGLVNRDEEEEKALYVLCRMRDESEIADKTREQTNIGITTEDPHF